MANEFEGPYHVEIEDHVHNTQPQPRRRKQEGDNAELYSDLERLRNLVEDMEGENSGSGCFTHLSLDNSMMSTIFALVFLVILTVSTYAFYALYKAISKRFFFQ